MTPTMTWNNASTATTGSVTYRLQIASALAFGSASVLYQKDSISDTSFAVATTLTNDATYYWRVGVKDAAGHSSPYSTIDSFTTVVAVATSPNLVSPTEGQAGVSLTPTMTWNNASTAATGAVTYRLQIASALAFGSASVLYQKDSISDTSFAVATSLTNNTTYYWRVGVKDAAGHSSPYSAIDSFTTIIAPPVLSSSSSNSVPNLSVNVSITPTLSWGSVPGANSYELQVSTSSSFVSNVFDQSGPNVTSVQVTGLLNNTVYYWHVDAIGPGERGSVVPHLEFYYDRGRSGSAPGLAVPD